MQTLPIGYDLAGRIANLNWRPTTEWAVPILEAVSNSLHATEELGEGARRIEVALIREGDDQTSLLVESQKERPIVGFRVTDNGVGFTEENFKAFLTIDSRHKETKGGKGIGRLFWLKAFEIVNVFSVYREGGKKKFRKIVFTKESLKADAPTETDKDVQTVIEVKGLRFNYKEYYRKYASTLVKEIANEFLPYFILKGWPGHFTLTATDKSAERANIRDEITYNHSFTEFEIRGVTFKVNHIANYSTESNIVSFCASGRTVTQYKVELGDTIPKRMFRDEDGKAFSYICILESQYLDKKVSSERTHFIIPDTPSEVYSGDDNENIDLATIISHLKHEIDVFLKPFVSVMVKETTELLTSILALHPELKLIECSDEDVRSMLGSSENEIKKKLRIKMHEVEDRTVTEMDMLIQRLGNKEPIDYTDFSQKFSVELERYSTVGQSRLVSYVVYRKHVLGMLKAALEATPSGKTVREQLIHKIIFPMGMQGKPTDFNSGHNLWVIDDRLACTDWIASDLAIGKHNVLYSTDDKLEPDIVCYNLAYADQSSKDALSRLCEIHIVEFKRPITLKVDNDPIQQIIDYVYALKSNKAFRLNKVDGAMSESTRHVSVADNARFFGYAIFDQSEFDNTEIWNKVKHRHELREFMNGYICQRNDISILVLSYNALIDVATARNSVFFNKLSGHVG